MNDIMIGTWAWGAGYNGSKMVFGMKYNEATLEATFRKATELGFRNWDTAAAYGMGSCERLLGRFMQGRDDIYLSTKYVPAKRFKKGALAKSFEESMERLGRDYADLFWLHLPNNLTENLHEAVPLLKDGRIRSLGISNVSLANIRLAEKLLAKEGLQLGAVQNHFSLLRNDQQPLIDHCNSSGIRYYAYMVLEQGALTGKYDEKNGFPAFSMRSFAFPKSKFRKIGGLLDLIRETAAHYEIDPSQVPILWAMGKGAVPIVGITKPSHAVKLAAAMPIRLTKEELDRLTAEAQKTGIRQQGMWEPQ
ncbi:MAG: aldo/keto reductase [Oscillospiraceae bacterium]|nr:aldo/keto reductase [Oscillospiraceae bacterium]